MIVWGMLVETNRSELESDSKEFKVLCFSPLLQYVKIIRYDHSLSVRSLNCSPFIEACVTFCSLAYY